MTLLKQSALTKKPFELAPVVRGSPEPSPGGERCTICTCGTKKVSLYFIVVKCSLAGHHNVFCHTAHTTLRVPKAHFGRKKGLSYRQVVEF
jgi:hypothetical protein